MKPRNTLAVEGSSDLAFTQRIAGWAGFEPGLQFGFKGKNFIDNKLRNWNAGAKLSPWLVVRDQNSDGCAPSIRQKLLPAPAKYMCFRIVPGAIESWALADREGFAEFFAVPVHVLPREPETLPKPKDTLLKIVHDHAKNRALRAMQPTGSRGAPVGPAYESFLIEFASTIWSPSKAAKNAPMLKRAYERLVAVRKLVQQHSA